MDMQIIIGIVILWVALALAGVIVAGYLISRVNDLEILADIWTKDVMELINYAARGIVDNQKTIVDGNDRITKCCAEHKKTLKEIREDVLMLMPLPESANEEHEAPAGDEIILPDPDDMKRS